MQLISCGVPTLATSCSTTLSTHSKRTSNVGCFNRSFSNSVQTREGGEGRGGRGEGYSGTVGYIALLLHVDVCVCVCVCLE